MSEKYEILDTLDERKKAVRLKIKAYGFEIKTWFPKSIIKRDGDTVEVQKWKAEEVFNEVRHSIIEAYKEGTVKNPTDFGRLVQEKADKHQKVFYAHKSSSVGQDLYDVYVLPIKTIGGIKNLKFQEGESVEISLDKKVSFDVSQSNRIIEKALGKSLVDELIELGGEAREASKKGLRVSMTKDENLFKKLYRAVLKGLSPESPTGDFQSTSGNIEVEETGLPYPYDFIKIPGVSNLPSQWGEGDLQKYRDWLSSKPLDEIIAFEEATEELSNYADSIERKDPDGSEEVNENWRKIEREIDDIKELRKQKLTDTLGKTSLQGCFEKSGHAIKRVKSEEEILEILSRSDLSELAEIYSILKECKEINKNLDISGVLGDRVGYEAFIPIVSRAIEAKKKAKESESIKGDMISQKRRLGISTKRVTIQKLIPAKELSDEQMVQRAKFANPSVSVERSFYDSYMRLRFTVGDLELSLQEYTDIYNRVEANPVTKDVQVDFKATHRHKETGEEVMIVPSYKKRGADHIIMKDGTEKHGNSIMYEKIEVGKVKIQKLIPAKELSNAELISRIKYENPTLDAGSAYGLFVKARELKPDIDLKEFAEIFNTVNPDPSVKEKEVDFVATHRDTVTGATVMISPSVRVPGGINIVWDYGMSGGDPQGNKGRYIPLDSEPLKKETEKTDISEPAYPVNTGALYYGFTIPEIEKMLKEIADRKRSNLAVHIDDLKFLGKVAFDETLKVELKDKFPVKKLQEITLGVLNHLIAHGASVVKPLSVLAQENITTNSALYKTIKLGIIQKLNLDNGELYRLSDGVFGVYDPTDKLAELDKKQDVVDSKPPVDAVKYTKVEVMTAINTLYKTKSVKTRAEKAKFLSGVLDGLYEVARQIDKYVEYTDNVVYTMRGRANDEIYFLRNWGFVKKLEKEVVKTKIDAVEQKKTRKLAKASVEKLKDYFTQIFDLIASGKKQEPEAVKTKDGNLPPKSGDPVHPDVAKTEPINRHVEKTIEDALKVATDETASLLARRGAVRKLKDAAIKGKGVKLQQIVEALLSVLNYVNFADMNARRGVINALIEMSDKGLDVLNTLMEIFQHNQKYRVSIIGVLNKFSDKALQKDSPYKYNIFQTMKIALQSEQDKTLLVDYAKTMARVVTFNDRPMAEAALGLLKTISDSGNAGALFYKIYDDFKKRAKKVGIDIKNISDLEDKADKDPLKQTSPIETDSGQVSFVPTKSIDIKRNQSPIERIPDGPGLDFPFDAIKSHGTMEFPAEWPWAEDNVFVNWLSSKTKDEIDYFSAKWENQEKDKILDWVDKEIDEERIIWDEGQTIISGWDHINELLPDVYEKRKDLLRDILDKSYLEPYYTGKRVFSDGSDKAPSEYKDFHIDEAVEELATNSRESLEFLLGVLVEYLDIVDDIEGRLDSEENEIKALEDVVKYAIKASTYKDIPGQQEIDWEEVEKGVFPTLPEPIEVKGVKKVDFLAGISKHFKTLLSSKSEKKRHKAATEIFNSLRGVLQYAKDTNDTELHREASNRISVIQQRVRDIASRTGTDDIKLSAKIAQDDIAILADIISKKAGVIPAEEKREKMKKKKSTDKKKKPEKSKVEPENTGKIGDQQKQDVLAVSGELEEYEAKLKDKKMSELRELVRTYGIETDTEVKKAKTKVALIKVLAKHMVSVGGEITISYPDEHAERTILQRKSKKGPFRIHVVELSKGRKRVKIVVDSFRFDKYRSTIRSVILNMLKVAPPKGVKGFNLRNVLVIISHPDKQKSISFPLNKYVAQTDKEIKWKRHRIYLGESLGEWIDFMKKCGFHGQDLVDNMV